MILEYIWVHAINDFRNKGYYCGVQIEVLDSMVLCQFLLIEVLNYTLLNHGLIMSYLAWYYLF